MRVSQNQIIWGGNYFPSIWQHGGRCVIAWDKCQPWPNFRKSSWRGHPIINPPSCLNLIIVRRAKYTQHKSPYSCICGCLIRLPNRAIPYSIPIWDRDLLHAPVTMPGMILMRGKLIPSITPQPPRDTKNTAIKPNYFNNTNRGNNNGTHQNYI